MQGKNTASTFITTGSIFAMLGVLLGAFGAHILKNQLTAGQINTYQTGIEYQMYHSFAILLAGLYQLQIQNSKLLRYATTAFIIGIILFSGSLYCLSITGFRWMGAVTPFGGIAFIVGWLCFASAAIQFKKSDSNNDN